MTLAGFPAMTTLSPTDLFTTEPAPTTTFSPMVTPPITVTSAPIQQLFPIDIGLPNSIPLFHSTGSNGCSGVTILTPGPNMTLFPIWIGQTSRKIQLKFA